MLNLNLRCIKSQLLKLSLLAYMELQAELGNTQLAWKKVLI